MSIKTFWWHPDVVKFRLNLTIGLSCAILVLLWTGLFQLAPIYDDTQKLLHLFDTEPIVSIYIPLYYQGSNCGVDYEAVAMNLNAVSVSKGACGCTLNPLSYQSSNASCSASSESSNYCMSLGFLLPVESETWRESTICVKRVGPAAATYKKRYHSRPHPNDHSRPRKCGAGLTYSQGAVCFPTESECPITNVMVVASDSAPPRNEGWVCAGTFHADNSTLYVRREHVDELPVVDIVPQLTELTASGENLRGQCVSDEAQNFNTTLEAIPSALWEYRANMPHKCKQSDPRYVLFANVTLEDNFLQNLQSEEPTCSGFELYAVSDPRYNRTRDPDFLNSGVPCALSSSQYTCVRNPYQHTDCATGDSVCAGVVHQNICGEFARAVRSAFAGSDVTLGLYYARELQWSNNCAMSKKDVFIGWPLVLIDMFYTSVLWILLWRLYIAISLHPSLLCAAVVCALTSAPLIAAALILARLNTFYDALAQGTCTDSTTAHILMDNLHPATICVWFVMTALCLEGWVVLMHVISYLCSERGYSAEFEAQLAQERALAQTIHELVNRARQPVRTTATVNTTDVLYTSTGTELSSPRGSSTCTSSQNDNDGYTQRSNTYYSVVSQENV